MGEEVTVQEFERAALALAVWHEAGDCNIDTMLCIAFTIKNLAKRDEIGVGAAIVKHRLLHGIEAHADVFPDVRDPRITKMLQRIDEVDSQFAEDLTNKAIYYINMGKPVPEKLAWLLKHPDGHTMCGISGQFHFFN